MASAQVRAISPTKAWKLASHGRRAPARPPHTDRASALRLAPPPPRGCRSFATSSGWRVPARTTSASTLTAQSSRADEAPPRSPAVGSPGSATACPSSANQPAPPSTTAARTGGTSAQRSTSPSRTWTASPGRPLSVAPTRPANRHWLRTQAATRTWSLRAPARVQNVRLNQSNAAELSETRRRHRGSLQADVEACLLCAGKEAPPSAVPVRWPIERIAIAGREQFAIPAPGLWGDHNSRASQGPSRRPLISQTVRKHWALQIHSRYGRAGRALCRRRRTAPQPISKRQPNPTNGRRRRRCEAPLLQRHRGCDRLRWRRLRSRRSSKAL